MHPGARQELLAAAARRLLEAVLESPAVTPADLRRAAFDGDLDRHTEEPVTSYVAKVRDHAHRVTDADIAALRDDGLSGDAIFELTVAAALGAAHRRLVAGLAVLDRGGAP